MINAGDKIENIRTAQKMHFLKTWQETNGAYLQIECASPPSTEKEKEHIHPYQENRFYITEGQLTFMINGKEHIAYTGDTVSIPKKTPHSFQNTSDKDAHYIQEFYPALKIDGLFETFFAMAKDGTLDNGGAPNIFRTALILLAYQNELRLTRPPWLVQKIFFSLIAPIAKLLGYKAHYQY